MRAQRFSLDGEDPARLELRWRGTTADVFLDGQPVATLAGPDALKIGWSTQLTDGSTLEVRAIRRVLFPELSILRNGQHVASSPSHPERMLSTSVNTLIAVSVFMIVAAVFHLWGRTWVAAIYAVFYLIGAFVLRTRRAAGALVIAVPLIIELAWLLFSAVTNGISGRWVMDLVVLLLFATFVVRAYHAAQDSRELRRAAAMAMYAR